MNLDDYAINLLPPKCHKFKHRVIVKRDTSDFSKVFTGFQAINNETNGLIAFVDCKVASEGRQGLFEIQKRDYDLMLLDISMPDYSGFDILKQLKKQGVRHKNIVILIAWNVKMEDFTDYLEVGVKEILKKPIGLNYLDNVVKSYLMNVGHAHQKNFLSNG